MHYSQVSCLVPGTQYDLIGRDAISRTAPRARCDSIFKKDLFLGKILPTDGTRLPIVVSSGDFGTSSLLSSSQASTVLNRKERYTGSGPTPNEICALCERVLCHFICETSVRAI